MAAQFALAAAGCGYAVPAAIVAASSGGGGGGGGGGTVGGGFTAEISDVPRSSAAPQIQPVSVRLVDANGESAALRLEFRDDGAGATAFAPATLARVRQGGPTGPIVADGPFTTTPFLASAPAGAVYFFEWLWQGNVGPAPRTNVALQLVVAQTAGGLGSGVAFTTTGRKVGNEPPALSAVEVVGQSGVVVVRFAVQDSSADICNIEATFQADSDPARALAALDPGALAGIAAPLAPPPLSVDFLWDTAAANQVGARRSNVVVALVAVDEAGARSAPVAAPAVTIENDTPPRALVTPVPRATSGTATILYSLVDAESQPTGVEVTFESEDGLLSGIATAAGGDGIAGLATAPSGAAHFFVWDYAEDVSETANRILLTIRPTAASGVAGTILISVGNSAPVASFQPPPAADVTGLAPIDFAVTDASGDLVQAILEFSTDGGQSFLAVATDSQTIGLAPGPRSIVWRTADDLPLADGVPVVLRLRASDGLPNGDGPAVTAPTRVDNVGNRPPVATIATPARTPAGDVTVPFTLFDPDGDPASALFEYVPDGGGPVAANPGPGGTATTFVWDADGQLGSGPFRVKMRLTPSDVTLTGAPVESGFFFVGNSAPAAAFTSTFPGTSRGAIEVPFTLEDGQGDPAAVALSFSTNGGASFQVAVTAGATIALSTGGAGAPASHLIFWRSDLDLPGAAATPVVLRLSAADGFPLGAGAAVTAALVVENAFGRPPSALVFDVPRTATGLATIPYALFDLEGDPIDIAVAFSLDGTSFSTALPGPGGDGTTGLSASGDGDPHAFVWDYGSQIGLAARSGVIVRVTPSDAGGPGAFGLSPPCRIGNEPPAFAGAPPEGIGGPERPVIRFTLADSSADVCSVVPSFSIQGSGVFTPISAADVVAGATAGLAATPAGRTFDFAWNAAGQIGTPPQQVVVRLLPSDPFATGVEALTATFTAGAAMAAANRPPSVAITTPERSTTGKLAVFYELFDAESDFTIDVLIEFSTNGGVSFVPALESTDPADMSEGTTGLFGIPGGFTFRFVWDFGAQIGLGAEPDVRIRITPSDPVNANTGAPATSAPFLLGNDPPEVVGPLEVTGSALTPTIRFALRDSSADATSVRLRYSLDGGPTIPIAPSFLVSGTIEGLAAPAEPAGLLHEVIWNAAAQVATAGSVVVDVLPTDLFGAEGATVTAAPFTLAAPGTLTVTAIRPAEGPAAGGTSVEIDGAGFVDGSTSVLIDGVPAAGVLVLSGNLLAARTPPGLLGARDVEVTVGATPLTLTAGFAYRPSIAFKSATGFVPESGPAPVEIVLTGDGVTPLPPGGVLVTVATGLGSATLDRDYTGPAQTQIGFTGSGAGPRTVTLNAYTIVPDGFREPDETIRIELRAPALAILDAPSVRSLTILDDDARAFAFDALPARPHVTESTSLSWFFDAAPSASSFDLAPGGTSVGAIDSSLEAPFPAAPAEVDPRAGFRVSQLRANDFDVAEIEGRRQVGAIGDDTGLAVAAMPDGGAVFGGAYANQPVIGQGEPGAVTLPASSGTQLRLFIARYREDQSLLWATAISGTATVVNPPFALAAYPDGGVVAAGSFRTSVRFLDAGALGGPGTTISSTATADAAFVVRYRPDGTVAWARAATGAAGASGDDNGNAVSACLDGGAVVAGDYAGSLSFGPDASLPSASGTADAFVARYRADGSVAWVRRGTGATEDRSLGVAATPDGGAIAVGRFNSATCTFSEAGEPLVKVDRLPTGATDAFVVRLGPDGRPLWAQEATGSGGTGEIANAVAALPDGSCYVGGHFAAPTIDFGGSIFLGSGQGPNDGFLARYDPAGDIQWARVFRGGTASSNGRVLGVVALADGSAATCGIVDGTIALTATGQPDLVLTSGGATADGFLARHDGDGRLCWAVRAGSSGGEGEQFNAIAGMPDGRVVAAGTFRSTTGLPVVFGPGEPGEAQMFTPNIGSPHPTDAFLVRYRPHSYTMLELRPEGVAWAILVTGTAAAVAGSHDGDVAQAADFVARYRADGALRWASPLTSTALASGRRGVATFLDGTTIAAGDFAGTITFGGPGGPTLTSAGGRDPWVAKYGADGDVLWRLGLGGAADDAAAVGVSPAGDGGALVAIEGVTLAARVSGSGSLLWTVESSGIAQSTGIAAFSDGGSVVVGFFSGQPTFGAGLASATVPAQPADGGLDGYALRLSPEGQVVWLRTLGGGEADEALGVAASADGSVVVAGDFPGKVVRLDIAGAVVQSAGVTGGTVRAFSAAALPDGGAAVAGTFDGGATFPGLQSFPGAGAFVLRLARDGSSLWVERIGDDASTVSLPTVAGQTDRSVILGGRLAGSVILGDGEPNAQPLDTGGATQGFVGKFYPYE